MNNRIVEPKLKFSEFSKYESWHIAKLKDLAIKITKKNKDSKILRVLTNSSTAGIIDQVEYFERKIVDFNNISSYYIVSIGDYVYNPRISSLAPVGPISKNKIAKGIVSPLYTVFRFKNQVNDFYEQYFKTSHWHKYLKQNSNMGARHDRISISDKVFFNMPIPYSQEPEQQKIAECLNSIDELIVGEEDKLKELKNHKNGLLQKLFPKNNSSNPELRFPEFKEDWVKTNFEKLLKYERPDKYIVDNTNYNIEGTPVLTANKAFILGYIDENFGIYTKLPVIIFDDFTVDKKYVEFSFKVKSSAIKILKPKFNDNLKFIYELMRTVKFSADEHKRYYISTYQYIDVFVPQKIEEQNKIAECLNSIDDLISAQTEKIEALKLHKKGLMQGLFPSLEDVKDGQ